MKGGYIFIVGDKLELMETNDDLILVDGSSQDNGHKSINARYKSSGKVILSLCKLHQYHKETYYSWSKSEATLLNKSKDNVMKGHSSHFGSTGNYYSFCNRANYGMVKILQLTNMFLRNTLEKIAHLWLKQTRNILKEWEAEI